MGVRGARDGVGVAAVACIASVGDVPRVAAALRAARCLRQTVQQALVLRRRAAAVAAA